MRRRRRRRRQPGGGGGRGGGDGRGDAREEAVLRLLLQNGRGDYLEAPTAPPTCSPRARNPGTCSFPEAAALAKPGAGGLAGPRFPAGSSRSGAGPQTPTAPLGAKPAHRNLRGWGCLLRARGLSGSVPAERWRRRVGAGGSSPSVTLEAEAMEVKSGCRGATSPLALGLRLDGGPSAPLRRNPSLPSPALQDPGLSPPRFEAGPFPAGLGRLPVP